MCSIKFKTFSVQCIQIFRFKSPVKKLQKKLLEKGDSGKQNDKSTSGRMDRNHRLETQHNFPHLQFKLTQFSTNNSANISGNSSIISCMDRLGSETLCNDRIVKTDAYHTGIRVHFRGCNSCDSF